MTAPRLVLPKSDYLISKECLNESEFFKPSLISNQIFLYCIAWAARETGMKLLFAVTLPSGYVCGLRDDGGRHPKFTEIFHGMLARAMNRHLGRRDCFWSGRRTAATRLVSPAAALGAMVKSLVAPVQAQLTSVAKTWKGVTSLQAQLGDQTLVIDRPSVFFRTTGDLPERIALRFVRPRGWGSLTRVAWRKRLRREIKAAARRIHGAVRARAESPAKVCRRLHPRLPPTELRRIHRFRALYAACLQKFRNGSRDVIFPRGTYFLRARRLASCIGDRSPWPAPG